jgi:hypothetical protein
VPQAALETLPRVEVFVVLVGWWPAAVQQQSAVAL